MILEFFFEVNQGNSNFLCFRNIFLYLCKIWSVKGIFFCQTARAAPYDDVTRIPQPTILREGPGSFGLEITEFYLNPTLSHSLDLKLQRFLNIPNNLQFLYERVMRKIDLMEEQMIKAELRKIDSEHSSRLGLEILN